MNILLKMIHAQTLKITSEFFRNLIQLFPVQLSPVLKSKMTTIYYFSRNSEFKNEFLEAIIKKLPM